jgi:hypothetical protein
MQLRRAIIHTFISWPQFRWLGFESQRFDHRSCCEDFRAAVLCEGENVAAIAADQIVGLPRFSHRQKKIIRRINGAIHDWPFLEYQRLGTHLIYKSTDIAALDETCQALATTEVLELFQLFLGTHEYEALVVPRINQPRRSTLFRNQRTDEQRGIEYDAHPPLRPSATCAETFRAGLGQGFFDGLFDFLGRYMCITCASFPHGLLKDAPARSLLDEFGEIALLHPLLCQKTAHGYIGRLRNLDAPGRAST